MENKAEEEADDVATDDDNIRKEFKCFICLELLYKPVVVACGHMACFWCIFRAMDNVRKSQCPLCRHPYHHFPRICKLLHFMLQKLYPTAYARREKQISEDEERSGKNSPQFDNFESGNSASTGVLVPLDSKSFIPEDIKATITTGSSPETNIDTVKPNGCTTNELPDGSNSKLVMNDLTCGLCKQLLFRPVVLNCGDVCCEACISKSSDTICKCPVCQSIHPSGFPNMCWILEHFLEEEFPEQYAAKKEWYSKENNDQLRSSAGKVSSSGSNKSFIDVVSLLAGRGPKVHPGVGCDYCGVCPIVGERYRCKDCKEIMGFDLCEGCYDSSCKLPGRFNQQHTEDHQFEKTDIAYLLMLGRFSTVSIPGNPLDYRSALLRDRTVDPEEIGSNDMQEHEDGSPSPEDIGDSPETPIIIYDDDDEDDGDDDTSEDGEEGMSSRNDTGELVHLGL